MQILLLLLKGPGDRGRYHGAPPPSLNARSCSRWAVAYAWKSAACRCCTRFCWASRSRVFSSSFARETERRGARGGASTVAGWRRAYAACRSFASSLNARCVSARSLRRPHHPTKQYTKNKGGEGGCQPISIFGKHSNTWGFI